MKNTVSIGMIITALFLATSFGCGGNGEGEETGGTIGTGGTGTGGTTTDTNTSTSTGTGGQAGNTGGVGGVGGMGTGGTTTVVVNPVPDWCTTVQMAGASPNLGQTEQMQTGLWNVSCNGVAWNLYITSSDGGHYTIAGYGFKTSELNYTPANGATPSDTIYEGLSASNCFIFHPIDTPSATDKSAPVIFGNGATWIRDSTDYRTSGTIIDAQTLNGVPCTMTWTIANQPGGQSPHCIAPVGC